MWNSTENIIKQTRSDVLVIFDCCHAGELDRSVRGFARRAYEFLAATSANSTTRKPGPQSFTSALIWSLKHLATTRTGIFSTAELVRTILYDAPDFPRDQVPRLCEPSPVCLRKIFLGPIKVGQPGSARETDEVDNNEMISESSEERQDLSVRFVFDQKLTSEMVRELATGLGRLLQDSNVNIKAKAVLWDGINHVQFSNSIAKLYAHRWVHKARKASREKTKRVSLISPTQIIPTIDPVPDLTFEPPVGDDSLATTPVPVKTADETLIVDDDNENLAITELVEQIPEEVSSTSKKRSWDININEESAAKKQRTESAR